VHFLRRSFAWLGLVGVSTASLSTDATRAAQQKPAFCTPTGVVEQSCTNLDWVNVERDKPFMAERIVTSVTTAGPEVQLAKHAELVARDSAGRIRREHDLTSSAFKSPAKMAIGGIPSSQRDLNIDDQGELMSGLRVDILDCFNGKKTELTPSSHVAIVQQACSDLPAFQPGDHPYSYKFTRFLGTTNPFDGAVEDLGYKELQPGPDPLETFRVRGVRITWLGKTRDGDWNGKPIIVWELWMSDELGVTMLWTTSDLRKQVETRYTLQNIRKQEPDASLFSVPSGYKVSSWQ